jgi:O-acetylserine/cysteine efflux transporter
LTPLHTFAAMLIVAMWGLNFTVIRFGLDEFTPFTFATRFEATLSYLAEL